MAKTTFFGRKRRGIALVLMAMMMSIFVMAAAFATDFGRIYVVRSQLQSAADAAALAAIQAQVKGLGFPLAADTGKKYVFLHPVMGRANIDSAFAVDSVGSWILGTSTWVPEPDQTNWSLGVNAASGEPRDAVKVVARQTVPFTFGRFLGFDNRVVKAEAIAVWGSVTASTCVRPWAIPYQKLLDQLWLTRTTTEPTVAYDMTPADIDSLSQMTQTSHPVSLSINDNQNDPYTGPSQFYAIRIPAAVYADGTLGPTSSGGADYRAEIAAQSCAALRALYPPGTDPTVHLGDYMAAENGKMLGPTHEGISGQGQTPGICGTSDTCTPPIRIIAALWDTYGAAPGITNGNCSDAANNGCYHVKYLAEFTLTGWNQPAKEVRGYFNIMTLPANGSSGFTAGGTSTVLVKALVK